MAAGLQPATMPAVARARGPPRAGSSTRRCARWAERCRTGRSIRALGQPTWPPASSARRSARPATRGAASRILSHRRSCSCAATRTSLEGPTSRRRRHAQLHPHRAGGGDRARARPGGGRCAGRVRPGPRASTARPTSARCAAVAATAPPARRSPSSPAAWTSCYPRRHADLHRRVEAAGLVMSEAPLGTPPEAWRFPARNRIIAGLADAVVVVESRITGGSMHTADEALVRGVTAAGRAGQHPIAGVGRHQRACWPPEPPSPATSTTCSPRSASDGLDGRRQAPGLLRPAGPADPVGRAVLEALGLGAADLRAAGGPHRPGAWRRSRRKWRPRGWRASSCAPTDGSSAREAGVADRSAPRLAAEAAPSVGSRPASVPGAR